MVGKAKPSPSQSGLDEYTGLRKRGNRGWIWNRIVERLDVPVEQARGMFLAGPDPVDIDIAVSKGFRKENLDAIDTNPANVKAARREGVRAMCGDIVDFIYLWNQTPLDFVYVDSCSAFGVCLALLTTTEYGKGIRFGTVVAINMQRGRESRDTMRTIGFLNQVIANERITGVGKHRGKMASVAHRLMAIQEPSNRPDPNRIGQEIALLRAEQAIHIFSRPVFSHYRAAGSNIYMDAVVYRNAIQQRNAPPPTTGRFAPHFLKAKKTTQKLAANKALHTRSQGA